MLPLFNWVQTTGCQKWWYFPQNVRSKWNLRHFHQQNWLFFLLFFWRSNTLQPHTPVNSTPTRASFLVCNKPPAHQRHLSKETITFNLYINSIGQRKKKGGEKSPDNQSVATEAKKRHKAHIFPLPPSHISLFSVIPVFHLPTAMTVESRARIYSLSHFSVIFSN